MNALKLLALAAAVAGAAAADWHVARLGKSFRPSHHRVHTAAVRDDPVGGDVWPVAIYWTNVMVGTPPRAFPVAIDSGSDTLDIPLSGCSTCIHRAPNAFYSAANSSTSSPVKCNFGCSCYQGQCAFSNSYQTCDLSNPSAVCTIEGLLWEDQVLFPGASGSAKVQFGTITSQTSNFDQFQNIDGVVGLAGPAGGSNVFESLYNAGKLKQNLFAMCFVEGSVSNGTMTVGTTDPRLYNGTIQYTPNAGSYYYGLELESAGIAVGGKTIQGTSNTVAILDSGTNVLLLPEQLFQSFQSILESFANCDGSADGAQGTLPGVCGANGFFGGKCVPLQPAQLALFPEITLSFSGGVTLRMQPRTYLNLGERNTGYCLGVRNTGSGGNFIIGDTTMEDYYVVFDRANNQIGWAPVNRDNCGSI